MEGKPMRPNPAPRRCAIFGVNGYLGGNLAHALASRGCRVTGVRRPSAIATAGTAIQPHRRHVQGRVAGV